MIQTTKQTVDAELAKMARKEIHEAFNGLRHLLEEIEIGLRTQDPDVFSTRLFIATHLLKSLEKDFMQTGLNANKLITQGN